MLRVSVSQSSLQVDLSGLRTGDSQALDAIPNASTLIRLADAFMNHEPDHLANIRDEAASVIGELGVKASSERKFFRNLALELLELVDDLSVRL